MEEPSAAQRLHATGPDDLDATAALSRAVPTKDGDPRQQAARQPPRVLAIVNPISGWRNKKRLVRGLSNGLRQAGGRMSVEFTRGPGDATRIAARAGQDTDMLLVVGGDGTACEAINGLADAGLKTPVLLFGQGTENLLARNFRMPRTIGGAVRAMLHGQFRTCDLGTVNGRRFLAVSGVGFDGEAVHRLAAHRKGNITHLNYLPALWRAFWTHKFPHLRVESDGELMFEGQAMVFVGVIARYAIGLRILKRAKVDDGLLDVCVMPARNKFDQIRHSINVVLRRHLQAGCLYAQAREVRVTSPDADVPLQVDGDPAGFLPAHWSIRPHGVTVVTPKR